MPAMKCLEPKYFIQKKKIENMAVERMHHIAKAFLQRATFGKDRLNGVGREINVAQLPLGGTPK
jgi:hypothetical protein